MMVGADYQVGVFLSLEDLVDTENKGLLKKAYDYSFRVKVESMDLWMEWITRYEHSSLYRKLKIIPSGQRWKAWIYGWNGLPGMDTPHSSED